jgi:hypothetical protein
LIDHSQRGGAEIRRKPPSINEYPRIYVPYQAPYPRERGYPSLIPERRKRSPYRQRIYVPLWIV